MENKKHYFCAYEQTDRKPHQLWRHPAELPHPPTTCVWEHRMPAHSVIFVRSGKTGHRRQGRTDEVTAGNYVFMRRDCSVNVTKVPLDGKPYLPSASRCRAKELKRVLQPHRPDVQAAPDTPLAQTASILPQTVALKSLFDSFLPYADSTEALRTNG